MILIRFFVLGLIVMWVFFYWPNVINSITISNEDVYPLLVLAGFGVLAWAIIFVVASVIIVGLVYDVCSRKLKRSSKVRLCFLLFAWILFYAMLSYQAFYTGYHLKPITGPVFVDLGILDLGVVLLLFLFMLGGPILFYRLLQGIKRDFFVYKSKLFHRVFSSFLYQLVMFNLFLSILVSLYCGKNCGINLHLLFNDLVLLIVLSAGFRGVFFDDDILLQGFGVEELRRFIKDLMDLYRGNPRSGSSGCIKGLFYLSDIENIYKIVLMPLPMSFMIYVALYTMFFNYNINLDLDYIMLISVLPFFSVMFWIFLNVVIRKLGGDICLKNECISVVRRYLDLYRVEDGL